ncbi:MAG: RHS repeat-associated core domain-containing protein [Myxococcales bacterium]
MDRVIEEHDGSVTYFFGDDFEVRDGVSVVHAISGDRRVARLSRTTLQASLLGDFTPAPVPHARIDVGDAWLMVSARKAPVRHLYASARRVLLEHGPGTVFMHQDHLGSTTLATAAAGEPRGECAFNTAGEGRGRRGYTDEYTFTGQRLDSTTQLMHFQHRDLDPGANRWETPDPLFLTSSHECLDRPFECANGYQYVMNNPVDLFDPTGEKWKVTMVQPVLGHEIRPEDEDRLRAQRPTDATTSYVLVLQHPLLPIAYVFRNTQEPGEPASETQTLGWMSAASAARALERENENPMIYHRSDSGEVSLITAARMRGALRLFHRNRGNEEVGAAVVRIGGEMFGQGFRAPRPAPALPPRPHGAKVAVAPGARQ